MTSRREHDAQTAAAAAITRAQAHAPATDPDDWPPPIPPEHTRYPITPEVARAIRLHIQETHNAQLR